ncbi:MAG: protein-L-isoaspartate(D-aspartate) O-methyltransferase [Chloroflexi bacterium]|nr:protein-L-isoaspartate(D-aspartate) O-methyltransferase [Chloroflexota bacterium]
MPEAYSEYVELHESWRDDLESRREGLIAMLRAAIRDERVIDAIARVPREEFVAPELRAQAYDDRALPAGSGQTISQPFIVATMTSAASVHSTDRVLDVGTGTGYQAAVLSLIARKVVSVERVPWLAVTATERLRRLGYENVAIHLAKDDVLGWPDDAPYDAIVVAAGAPKVPEALIEQLAPGGRMVIPVGEPTRQELLVVRKAADGTWTSTDLGPCAFVPLIGPGGWENL